MADIRKNTARRQRKSINQKPPISYIYLAAGSHNLCRNHLVHHTGTTKSANTPCLCRQLPLAVVAVKYGIRRGSIRASGGDAGRIKLPYTPITTVV